jgi:hypothetical protein
MMQRICFRVYRFLADVMAQKIEARKLKQPRQLHPQEQRQKRSKFTIWGKWLALAGLVLKCAE